MYVKKSNSVFFEIFPKDNATHLDFNRIKATARQYLGSSAVDLAGNFFVPRKNVREGSSYWRQVARKHRRDERETGAWNAKGEGRRAEDSRVRVMCIGRDARINNSRVISRALLSDISACISTRLHSPPIANEEAKASRVYAECVTVLTR